MHFFSQNKLFETALVCSLSLWADVTHPASFCECNERRLEGCCYWCGNKMPFSSGEKGVRAEMPQRHIASRQHGSKKLTFTTYTLPLHTPTPPFSSFPVKLNFPLLQEEYWGICNSEGVEEGQKDRWMDVSPVVVHTEYHILLFSFGSLLLPVVGLNKMGPKRRRGGVGPPPILRFVPWKHFVCEKCHSS